MCLFKTKVWQQASINSTWQNLTRFSKPATAEFQPQNQQQDYSKYVPYCWRVLDWSKFSGVHQVKPARNKSSIPGSTLFRDHPLIIQSARRRNVETQDSQMFEMRQSFSCPLWKSDRETGPVMTKTSAGSNNGESNRAMTQTWSSLSQKCLNRSRTRVVRSEPTCFKLWFKVQTS